jgi:hypothetical protein
VIPDVTLNARFVKTPEANPEAPCSGGPISAETVEKPFSIVNGWFLRGLMTPRNYEIIDCGAFCEVIFFCISPKNLPGDFFDSLAMNVGFLTLRKVII